MPRGRKSPLPAPQLAFLQSHFPEFQRRQPEVSTFWKMVERLWFERWPVEPRLGLPILSTQGVLIEDSGLPPEHQERVGAAQAVDRAIIHNWFNNRAQKERRRLNAAGGGNGGAGGGGGGPGLQQLLAAFKRKKERRNTRVEVWQKLNPGTNAALLQAANYDDLAESSDEEETSAGRKARVKRNQSVKMVLQRRVGKEGYAAASEEEKAAVEKAYLAQNSKKGVNLAKAQTPGEFQGGLDNLGPMLKEFHGVLEDLTGWVGATVMTGPVPNQGGKIGTQSYCNGTTPAGHTLDEAVVGWNDNILKPLQQFGKKVFDHSVRRERALLATPEPEPAAVEETIPHTDGDTSEPETLQAPPPQSKKSRKGKTKSKAKSKAKSGDNANNSGDTDALNLPGAPAEAADGLASSAGNLYAQLQRDQLGEELRQIDQSAGTEFMWNNALPLAPASTPVPDRPQPRGTYRGAAFAPRRGDDDLDRLADEDFAFDFGHAQDIAGVLHTDYMGALGVVGGLNSMNTVDDNAEEARVFDESEARHVNKAQFELRPLSADSEATELLTTATAFVFQSTAPFSSSPVRATPLPALTDPAAAASSLQTLTDPTQVPTATGAAILRTPGMASRGLTTTTPSPLRHVFTAGAGIEGHPTAALPSPLRRVHTAGAVGDAGVQGQTTATTTSSPLRHVHTAGDAGVEGHPAVATPTVLLTADNFPESRPMSNPPLPAKSATARRGGASGRASGRGRGRGRGGGARGGRVALGVREQVIEAPLQPGTVQRVDPGRMREIRAMEKERDDTAARIVNKRRNPDGYHDLVVFPPPPPGHEPLPNGPAALGGGRVRRAPKNRDDFVYEALKKQTMAEIRAAAAAKKQAKEVVGTKRKSSAENENPAAEKRRKLT
ncbi:hypothetical protein B0H16DRAFT_1772982 [Mycena metata]|uniref:Uncharacterized protein n=1 Tax=Mycena metata TaxID=1033252 RepID=A0AAD7HZ28_9AGAR|nr:hypothetical protein B0H16DRAFT_1772982 [Mycena metata]